MLAWCINILFQDYFLMKEYQKRLFLSLHYAVVGLKQSVQNTSRDCLQYKLHNPFKITLHWLSLSLIQDRFRLSLKIIKTKQVFLMHRYITLYRKLGRSCKIKYIRYLFSYALVYILHLNFAVRQRVPCRVNCFGCCESIK